MKLLSWVFGAVLLPLLLSEFTELSPWLAECLVRRAARRIPDHERDDWEAEWLAELSSKRGRLLKLMWALRRLPLLRRGPREMARLLGAPPVSGVRARLRAARQRLRPKAPAHDPTPEPGVVQVEHAVAARAHLARALDEARGRLRTSERALAKAERDAEGAEELQRACAAAEQAVEAADTELAAVRERHAELRGAVGAAAARLESARTAAAAVAGLKPDAPCHACGQPLGAGHDELRGRRAEELVAAEAAHAEALAAEAANTAAGKALAERRAALAETLERARAAERRAAKAAALAKAASAAMELSLADVAARRQALNSAIP